MLMPESTRSPSAIPTPCRADVPPRYDVLIIGAGPAGLSLSIALLQQGLRVALLDRKDIFAEANDPRVLALSYGSIQFLARYQLHPAGLTPIKHIHISQRQAWGVTELDAQEFGIPALGYTILYNDLRATLVNKLRTSAPSQLTCYSFRHVRDIAINADEVSVTLSEADSGEAGHPLNQNGDASQVIPAAPLTIQASLVVHAEGTSSETESWQHRYRQQALVFPVKVSPESLHKNADHHWAWERFTSEAPFALLPTSEHYSAVLVCRNPKEWCAKPPEIFAEQLSKHFGRTHLSSPAKFTLLAEPRQIPLQLQLRKKLTDERQVWISNAAQTLHPVSGQGLNLGLRDVYALAEVLLTEAGDFNGAALRKALSTYEQKRQVDRWGSAAFTDGIVRIFSNALPGFGALRGLGLNVLSAAAPLKKEVGARMIWGSFAP